MTANPEVLAQSVFPAAKALQHGDLIWCRAKYAAVLRDFPAAALMNANETDYSLYGPTTDDDWGAELGALMARLNTAPGAADRLNARSIMGMPLEEFLARYQGSPVVQSLEGQARRALDSQTMISTGHVAIITVDKTTEERLVVEACRPALGLPKRYEEWRCRFRKPFYVWQGRLTGDYAGLAGTVADLARQWAAHELRGRPFSLWNFDLDDPSEFYCAKFVWRVVYHASNRTLGLDGRADPRRRFLDWCTPWSLMSSPHIAAIFDPTGYGITGGFARA
jgi:hypothetical protein